jgi:hypothetical protein
MQSPLRITYLYCLCEFLRKSPFYWSLYDLDTNYTAILTKYVAVNINLDGICAGLPHFLYSCDSIFCG